MASPLVVFTDFFAVTNRALSYAAALALPLKAELVLLHVRHNTLLSPDDYSHATPVSQHKTDQALQKLAADQPVPTQVDVSEEFLPDAVKEAVRRHHPLLLVMGRPGSATAPEELLTNTAMDLLRNAPYPLLVIPAAGWEAFPPRRLLLAVDGEPFRLAQHQDVLRQLLAATQGTLDIVRVMDDEHSRLGAGAVLETVRENDLRDLLPENRLHEVYHSEVAAGVLQEASRQEADLLVVVARNHSVLGGLFHSSVTARIIRDSPIPVLVLPAED